MQVGTISFRPYIYNANMLSGSSLSKVSSIGEDLLTGRTDFSALTDEENVNPLKKGESSNFVDILEMQMQMGRMNAARIMKPEEEEALQAADDAIAQESLESADMEETEEAVDVSKNENAVSLDGILEDFQPVSSIDEMQSTQPDRNLFIMRRAAEAYEANMTA